MSILIMMIMLIIDTLAGWAGYAWILPAWWFAVVCAVIAQLIQIIFLEGAGGNLSDYDFGDD